MIKTCDICGKKFESKQGGRRYCSHDCRVKARQRYLTERTCVICGKKFMTNKYRPTATCSKSCGNTYGHQVRRMKAEAIGYWRSDKDAIKKYHSDTLDKKLSEYGYKSGAMQSKQTLEMVGKVDVEGILAELSR